MKIHGNKRYEVQDEFSSFVVNYEKTGVLQKGLFDALWKRYNPSEKKFFLALRENMLLVSKYIFKQQHQETEGLEADNFVVPSMIKNECNAIEDDLPEEHEQMIMYLHFGRYLPRGLFERFF